jgi:flagellar basal-body rod modification protein FlgD
MAIDPSAGIGSPRPVDTGPSRTSLDDQGMGKDTFMRLLVAQMQNQDPMKPMDSREMISQLSDLTSVEQLTGIGDRLAALEIATAGMANTQVASVVGRNVLADGSGVRLSETGPVGSVYRLDGSAKDVKVEVRDRAGKLVRTMDLGAQFPGSHEVSWDGLADDGSRLPPGRYSFEVSAVDDAGNPVSSSFDIEGVVSGISYENGYPELLIGAARVLLGDVQRIEM